jgi:hypothetical protein
MTRSIEEQKRKKNADLCLDMNGEFFLQCVTKQARSCWLVGLGCGGFADGAPVLLPEPMLYAGDVVEVHARHLAHLLATRVLLLTIHTDQRLFASREFRVTVKFWR